MIVQLFYEIIVDILKGLKIDVNCQVMHVVGC